MTESQFRPIGLGDFKPPKPDSEPKRRGPGRPKGSGGRPRKSLQKELEGLLALINAIIRVGSPRDALDASEVAALAKALDEQAKKSARFRKGLEALLTTTGGTSLGVVIGIIAGRRMARRRMFGIPAYVDDIGGSVIQMMNVTPSEADAVMESIVGMMGMGTNDNASDSAAT